MKAKLDFIERGGRVQRMHTVPTLQPQSVAAHSFGVAWWCWLLSNEVPSAVLLMAALQHDLAEHETGDIPAPTKRKLEISKRVEDIEFEAINNVGMLIYDTLLTDDERRILKVADSLELVQHCIREVSMGNKTNQIYTMMTNAMHYAEEVATTQLELDAINLMKRIRNGRE